MLSSIDSIVYAEAEIDTIEYKDSRIGVSWHVWNRRIL